MGFLSKFIGIVLVLGGLYGLYLSVPPLLYNIAFDYVNPLVQIGIVKPSATANSFDVIISSVILLIGIALLAHKSKPKVR